MKHRLLLVDDAVEELEAAKSFLERRGFTTDVALSGEAALNALGRANSYSLVVLDYGMEGMDGTETMRSIRKRYPEQLVLVYSGNTTQSAVVLTSRAGAHGFVSKGEPVSVLLDEITRLCSQVEETTAIGGAHQDTGENEKLITSVGMVGRSRALSDIARRIHRLRDLSGTVMILGETGSGKELIAKALHGSRTGRLITFNCGLVAMNPSMACSDLFGHVKGAFTGASENKPGRMQLAQDGTLFLDEFYSLPAEAQVGLLRALEEKTVSQLGSNKEIGINCRIVVSAKPDLPSLAARGLFKSDLFYRVAQNRILVPPLCERPEDIRPLVEYFVAQWRAETGFDRRFHHNSLALFERYDWPGNVRQLRDFVIGLLNVSERTRVSSNEVLAAFRVLKGEESNPASKKTSSLEAQLHKIERGCLVDAMRKSKSLRDGASRLGISATKAFRLMRKHELSADIVGEDRTDRGKR